MQESIEMADNIAKRADICTFQSCEEETYLNRNSCIESTLDLKHWTVKELFYLSIVEIALCECEKEGDNYAVM